MKVTHKLPVCFHEELKGQAGCISHPHQISEGHLFWRNKFIWLQVNYNNHSLVSPSRLYWYTYATQGM